MKIEMLHDMTIEKVEHKAGAVVEMSEAVGRFLVRLHRAETAVEKEFLPQGTPRTQRSKKTSRK